MYGQVKHLSKSMVRGDKLRQSQNDHSPHQVLDKVPCLRKPPTGSRGPLYERRDH